MTGSSAFGARLGAHVLGAQTRFAAFSDAREVALVLFDEEGTERARHVMRPGADGVHELSRDDAPHGTRYKFALDGNVLPDPYAYFMPDGVHGPAMVVESKRPWRHPQRPRPLGEQVIYELHVGTFTSAGTYRAAMERLPALAELGVNTLELLPVASFPGARGWGYDGVALWAPFAPYGTPDELRDLVDEAHGLGLSVLLDVVYNHFGPAGNYLGAYHPAYFAKDVKNPWGDAPNYAHPAMRAFMIDNALYWLREFRFDGLRLDAVHEIRDPKSERHVLRELVERTRELDGKPTLIAEDDRNQPKLVQEIGLSGIWADDFHHQLRVTLTGERDGYYAGYQPGVEGIARAIERGWLYEGETPPGREHPRGHPAGELPREALVYCIQNHDQVGNRAFGTRLNHEIDLDSYCLASTLLLFLPMTPMLFMGQEWATSAPFLFFSDHDAELGEAVSKGRREEFKHFSTFSDPKQREKIPDPQDPRTFERCKLPWSEREREPHGRVLALYRSLLALRREDDVLRAPWKPGRLHAQGAAEVLRVTRIAEGQQRVLIANFASQAVSLADVDLPAAHRELLRSGPYAQREQLGPRSAAIFAVEVGRT